MDHETLNTIESLITSHKRMITALEKERERSTQILSPEKPKPSKPTTRDQVLEIGAGIEGWREWVEYRASIRKSLKLPTAKKQVAMLSKLAPEVQYTTLNNSITNGWQGLFPEKVDKQSLAERNAAVLKRHLSTDEEDQKWIESF